MAFKKKKEKKKARKLAICAKGPAQRLTFWPSDYTPGTVSEGSGRKRGKHDAEGGPAESRVEWEETW